MSQLVQLAAAYTILQSMSGLSFVDAALYGGWAGKGGDPFTVLTNLLSICTSFFLFYAGTQRLGAPRLRHCLPFVAVGLIFASAGWSPMPADTVRRAVNYAVLVVSAMGMARSMSAVQIMRMTVWICVGTAILSLAVYPTHIGHSFDPETGAIEFRGAFGSKNLLGEAMTAGVLAALYCARTCYRQRIMYYFLALILLIMAFASRSTTSFLVGLAYLPLLTVMVLYSKGGLPRLASVCLITVASIGGIVVKVAPDLAFSLLGKSSNLTGRTELWPYVLDQIAAKPLLGWGFNAFWMTTNPVAMSISDALGWYVAEAHNGLLEMLLQLGVVGTALFVFLILRGFALGAGCLKRGDKELGRVELLFLLGLLIMSVSEAILLTPSQVPTLQFFLFDFMCGVDLLTAPARYRPMRPLHGPMAAMTADRAY